MVDEIFCPNAFDEYLNNTTGASSSRSYGAKLTPVKQWERDCFGIYCSCCGFYAYRDQFGQPWKSNFCPNCGENLRGEENKMKSKKDYRRAIESVLWYNELWPIVQKWKYLPVDHGQIDPPFAYGCPAPEKNAQTYFQLQVIWMIAVELFGDCGVTLKSGWITDVDGFRRWITDLTYESALFASEREERKTNEVQSSH